jgi:glycosyltransferase involved in cell wall biosynthesis
MRERVTTAALPLVSVVINNYNYGRFLRAAIESALRQTYDPLEVIVVDDGSTDESRQIVESYGSRLRPVLKDNGGQGSAFNAGFRASRGELIAFLDADDVFLPAKVAGCVAVALSHPEADLVYHRMQRIDADGRPRGGAFPRRLYRGRIGDQVRRGGGAWLYAPTSGQLYRRAFLERIFPVPEQHYRISADAYVAGLAGLMANVIGDAAVLGQYRVHGQNGYTYAGADERQRLVEHNRRYLVEAAALNQALERLGVPDRVSVEDNFIYQLNRTKLGEQALPRIARLAVRDRGETWTRLKTLARNAAALARSAARAPAWPGGAVR